MLAHDSAWLDAVVLTPAYFLGDTIHRLAGPVGTITIILAALIIALLVFVWRNERQLIEKAEKALPGPLEAY